MTDNNDWLEWWKEFKAIGKAMGLNVKEELSVGYTFYWRNGTSPQDAVNRDLVHRQIIKEGRSMKVISIKDKLATGKHNQMWKGKEIKLNIRSAIKGGYCLTYEYEGEFQPFGEHGPRLPRTWEFCGVVVNYRWYHRLFRITEEDRVDYGMKLLKKQWARMIKDTKKFDNILNKYGVECDSVL